MSSTKRLERYSVRGIVEASYLAGGVPTVSDGILAMEVPDVELEYIYDGTRGRNPYGGQLSRVAPGGLGAATEFQVHAYTPGAAYSASVKPSVDALLRAAGFNVTTSFVGGSESYSYSPDVETPESLSLEIYVRGQKYTITGGYTGLQIASENLAIPMWTFPIRGVGAIPTDVTTPTDTTYPHVSTQKPQKSVNVALSILGVTTHILRGFEFDLGRDFTQRADENAAAGSGHKGFTPNPRAPRLTLTIEASALSLQDLYTARDAGTEGTVSMRHGASGAPGQYKRWTMTMPKAQIISVDDTDDGPSAMLEIEIAPAVTPGGATQDDVTFLFD